MCPRSAAKMGLARTSPCRENRDAIATGWSPAAVCVVRGVQSCYREVAPLQNNKKPHQNSPKDKVVVVRTGGAESVLGWATPVPLPSPVHCTPCFSSLSSR